MKILEEWGVKKVEFFYQWFASSKHNYENIEMLFKSKIIYLPLALAFVIGFVFTLPIVFFELILNIYQEPTLHSVMIYGVVTIISIFLEFYFLFLLGFATLAYYIHHLYWMDREGYDINQMEFLYSLVRTVMELPEKRVIKYNLNPYEYRETKIVILSLLYKLKVIATNMIAKFIVKKALTRSSLRLYSAYIAAPVTGIWDTLVFHKTMRESRYKIIVRLIAFYLSKHKIEHLLEEENIKIILFRYYYFGEYHNSLDFLLQSIYEQKPFAYSKESYLSVPLSNKKLLSLLFALKCRIFSSKEQSIMQEIQIYENVKALRESIKNSDMQSIKNYIDKL